MCTQSCIGEAGWLRVIKSQPPHCTLRVPFSNRAPDGTNEPTSQPAAKLSLRRCGGAVLFFSLLHSRASVTPQASAAVSVQIRLLDHNKIPKQPRELLQLPTPTHPLSQLSKRSTETTNARAVVSRCAGRERERGTDYHPDGLLLWLPCLDSKPAAVSKSNPAAMVNLGRARRRRTMLEMLPAAAVAAEAAEGGGPRFRTAFPPLTGAPEAR